MKKLFFALIIAGIALFSYSVSARINLGVDTLTKGAATKAGYDAATNVTTFASTVGTVIKAALSLTGVIFMSLIVYAGFLWMTAQGEESQIEKSQTMIRGAVIGLIITLGAYSITNFVVPKVLERATGSTPAQGSPLP